MTATAQNFTMYRGDNRNLNFTARDASNAVVDITGTTLRWSAKHAVNSGTADISKSTGGSGITITDGPNGAYTVALVPADTASLAVEKQIQLVHEVEITDVLGTVDTISVGTGTILRDINT